MAWLPKHNLLSSLSDTSISFMTKKLRLTGIWLLTSLLSLEDRIVVISGWQISQPLCHQLAPQSTPVHAAHTHVKCMRLHLSECIPEWHLPNDTAFLPLWIGIYFKYMSKGVNAHSPASLFKFDLFCAPFILNRCCNMISKVVSLHFPSGLVDNWRHVYRCVGPVDFPKWSVELHWPPNRLTLPNRWEPFWAGWGENCICFSVKWATVISSDLSNRSQNRRMRPTIVITHVYLLKLTYCYIKWGEQLSQSSIHKNVALYMTVPLACF